MTVSPTARLGAPADGRGSVPRGVGLGASSHGVGTAVLIQRGERATAVSATPRCSSDNCSKWCGGGAAAAAAAAAGGG